jgi:hypothetical protein
MALRRSALALATLLFALPARADDRATAQELFQQGKDLLAAGQTAQACTKFAAAAELVSTAGVRLNLASCYEKIGRTASAWTRYDEALTIAERSGDTAAAAFARDAKAALSPRLSYLAITVPTEAFLAGLVVTRDGEKIPPAAWGAAIPVDPGDHQIVATAPGHDKWSTVTNVNGEKTRASISVPVLKATPAPPAPPEPVPVTSPPPAKSGMWSGPGAVQREAGLIAAGLGVVGLGVGAVFGVEMLSNKQTASSPGYCNTADCGSKSQSAVSDGNIATAGFAAGGGLLVLGVALFVSAPTSPKATATRIVPLAVSRGGGVGVVGAF